MAVNPIDHLAPMQPLEPLGGKKAAQEEERASTDYGFKDVLAQMIESAEATADTSSQFTDALLSGDINDLHSAVIAGQKAELSLNLMIQVRNKVVDAYNEIMRMQV